MTLNQIKKAAEIAKSRTSDKRWLAAIDKAVAGVESGWWIITELANCLAITTETGKTYRANDKHCQCEAFFRDQACKHRALYRLYSIAESDVADEPATSRPSPRIFRSIESDRTGVKLAVVRCDGWMI
jgi:hypothetical protein